METFKDYPKNIDVIRQNLSSLKKLKYGYYEYAVGDKYPPHFIVKIFPHRVGNDIYNSINKYRVVDVLVEEFDKRNTSPDRITYNRIHLNKDERLKNYQAIKYGQWNGEQMPIPILCELIKYLYRLSNLAAFI